MEILDIKQTSQIQILEDETQTEKFWDNSIEAKKILKEINKLKIWINLYDLVKNIEDLEVLIELCADEHEIDTQLKITIQYIEDLEFKNMLSADEDN